jgi:uncharacterized protein YqjF (DUF2071 family)
MSWCELAFLHWPFPKNVLESGLPRGLELDTFEGEAWLGIVPFRMADVRARLLPPVPTLANFAELNVRTYVVAGGKPGVWFYSLDAESLLAVRAARRGFHLPYLDARMAVARDGGIVSYRSERTHPGAPEARFVARYRGTGRQARALRGSLEHWLTERYCLYAADEKGKLFRGEIHHRKWPLEEGEVELDQVDMTRLVGASLPDSHPLVHVSERIDVIAWWLEPLESEMAHGRESS